VGETEVGKPHHKAKGKGTGEDVVLNILTTMRNWGQSQKLLKSKTPITCAKSMWGKNGKVRLKHVPSQCAQRVRVTKRRVWLRKFRIELLFGGIERKYKRGETYFGRSGGVTETTIRDDYGGRRG